MKMRPVGDELFHAGGRTDRQTYMTKLIVAFGNFASAPKNVVCVRVGMCACTPVFMKYSTFMVFWEIKMQFHTVLSLAFHGNCHFYATATSPQ